MMSYKFIAKSDSDPNGKNGGLGYNTHEEAQKHCVRMNSLIDLYDETESVWNKEFWKTKPLQWAIHERTN